MSSWRCMWTEAITYFTKDTGDYTIDKKLGQGHFGSVYLVHEKTTGRPFIMKRYRSARAVRDATAQYTNLDHVRPQCQQYFVCPEKIYHYGGCTTLIMEYLDGYRDLQALIDDQSPMLQSPRNCQQILRHLVEGLSVLHRTLHMAHQDIKPANIMIRTIRDRKPIARFVDFGLGCIGSKCSKSIAGTPSFMAPEVRIKYMNHDAWHICPDSFARLWYGNDASQQTSLSFLEQHQREDIFSLGLVLLALQSWSAFMSAYRAIQKYCELATVIGMSDPSGVTASTDLMDHYHRVMIPKRKKLQQELNRLERAFITPELHEPFTHARFFPLLPRQRKLTQQQR